MSHVHWLIQEEGDLPRDDGWLAGDEVAQLADMPDGRRRTDWRLGCWTAKRALTYLLVAAPTLRPPAWLEIDPGDDGDPKVLVGGQPAPVKISVSGERGRAACVIAPAGIVVGCDLKRVASPDPGTADGSLTELESQLVKGAPEADRALLVSLLLSAKEGAGEVLRGRVGTAPGELETIPFQGPSRRGWRPLVVRYGTGDQVLHGWWRREGGHVLTLLCHPASRLPVALPIAAARQRGGAKRHPRRRVRGDAIS